MLAVRRQRNPCRRFVDVSAARLGRQISADRAGTSATDVSKSEVYMYIGVIGVKFEEINLKFEKIPDPHSNTAVIGRHSVFSIL